MRLTTTTQLSVDGVMQAPGVNVGEEEAGFERRGWAHFDDEALELLGDAMEDTQAALLQAGNPRQGVASETERAATI